jgi:transposase
LHRLVARQPGQRQRPSKQGGPATGPTPTDRGQPGPQHHRVVDRQGIPLAARLTGANRQDSVVLEAMVDAIAPITRPRGRPRRRPATLPADQADDFPHCRRALRRRHITPRIARRGLASKERLGRHRWVVARTLAGLNRFRRLTIRYEHREDIHMAFLQLSCALLCLIFLDRF